MGRPPSSLHVRARNIVWPMERWTLKDILYDGGPGQDALATGTWDGDPVLAQRWNGTSDHIKGFPVSTGYPVWQNGSLLDAGVLSNRITPAGLSHARRHLGLPDPAAPAASEAAS